jgi:hypothetical protein
VCRAIRQIRCIHIYNTSSMLWIPHCKGPLGPLPLVWWLDKIKHSSIRSQLNKFVFLEFYLIVFWLSCKYFLLEPPCWNPMTMNMYLC